MTDTDGITVIPCDICGTSPAEYDGDLCGPCYWQAVGEELSCDWLPDENEATT